MPSVILLAEDEFHELFLQALINRLSEEYGIHLSQHTYSARGGLPKMHHELGEFLRDLRNNHAATPDGILVATDANCSGYVDRRNLISNEVRRFPEFAHLMIYAIPDPHIERWMMVDPQAFRTVFGRGCTLPAKKCLKGLYKTLLSDQIVHAAGVRPPLGGREFAADIVASMDLPRAGANEPSLGHAIRDLRALFNRIRNQE